MLPEKTKIKFVKKNAGIFFFLFFLVVLIYFNSINNVFISDDLFGIVGNRDLDNFNNILSNPSSFIQNLIYYLSIKFGGYNPIFFRIFNILFHIGSVWLVYILIYMLYGKLTAFFSASIFAVQPILVESVVWISGGGYTRYGFFLLLTFISYIISYSDKKYYYVSLIFFLILLTLTPISMAFPLVILVYDFLQRKNKHTWRRHIPYFTLSGFFFIYTMSGAFQSKVESLVTSAYQTPGVDNPFILIPIAVVNYLSLITFPKDLTLYHTELSFSLPEYQMVLMLFVTFLIVVAVSYRKNKEVFFWLTFFLILLAPTLTPFRITWTVAERYAYAATLGIIVPFALLIKEIYLNKKLRVVGQIIFITVISIFSLRVIIRNIDWKTDENFWKSTARISPSSFYAHNNLGDVYGRLGDQEKAAEEFKKSILLNNQYAPAYHNLANVYRVVQKEDLALKYYQKSLAIDPNLWQAYLNMGSMYFNRKDYKKAVEFLAMAVKIKPFDPTLHYNLGIAYAFSGNKKKAEQQLSKAIKLDPEEKQFQNALIDLKKI